VKSGRRNELTFIPTLPLPKPTPLSLSGREGGSEGGRREGWRKGAILRRYNQRHDLVPGETADAIRQMLPPLAGFSVDLKDNYSLPLHIASTDLRPDIVWWEDNPKKIWLVELTVPFEMGFKDVAERKEASYEDLIGLQSKAGRLRFSPHHN